ncbi:RPM1-interacting protein 4 isoform X1 [Tripterygium wilfordii]|uniref:RPM1-interacting protein 4 isoform X1 n=1 Tax=Tripterygium wilfordii TaxID=458696 RepID=A0A7J7CZW8_TRIWF|nr:RPM1-interacting protein 4 isoform X1 [Tripterygium wilfordii]
MLMIVKGRPLPKFGEWDVNNPASAEGFTVIFSKAKDDKKASNDPPSKAGGATSQKKPNHNSQNPPTKNWFCCF